MLFSVTSCLEDYLDKAPEFMSLAQINAQKAVPAEPAPAAPAEPAPAQ